MRKLLMVNDVLDSDAAEERNRSKDYRRDSKAKSAIKGIRRGLTVEEAQRAFGVELSEQEISAARLEPSQWLVLLK